jgi:DNA-binding transcriptional LysR family regulator
MSQPGGALHNRILELFRLQGLPSPTENAYSYLLRQKMVSENIGISFSTHYPTLVPARDVCYIPLADPLEPWNARMYWPKKHSLTDGEKHFLAFTKDFYNGQH